MRYHWLYALSFLTATPLADSATPLAPWDDMRVKHTWSAVPANWETLGCPSAGTTIDLYIALNPYQESALIDALYEVSDPKHPRHVHLTAAPLAPSSTYGAHLSKEEVAELVRPHPDTLELVTSWLAHHGVRTSSISTTHGGAWLTVSNVLVSQADQMLGASYQLYRHAKVNDTIIRTVSYALPEVLHAHVQAVAPTTYFASTRTQRQTSRRALRRRSGSVGRGGGGSRTFAYVPTAADRNTLGVFGYQKQYPSETDLNMYMATFRSDVQPPGLATFTVELVNGGEYDPGTPGIEANLDVQYASAMAYPTPIIFYSTGGIGKALDNGEPAPGDMYLESLEYLLRKTDIPQTISISYGNKEWIVPQEYARVLCTLFAQLGARGVSVLFPSGDEGVGKDCTDDSGNFLFVPEFPASCPYITAVGGTGGYDPEVAAPLSGGGFSDHFPRPVYQDLALSTFFPWRPWHPRHRRPSSQFPPLRQKHWYCCGWHERLDSRLRLDSSISGYTATDLRASTTVTSGSNPGCGTNGFSAAPGWDPVTGLGTPDFEKLQNIFMTPLGGGVGQGNQPKIRGPGE
ncbi:subtilisin-like protein [Lactarius hatsudake]|nr:subtilisin-like protein [Lactarius hatsudake]